MTALRECPFCGGEAKLTDDSLYCEHAGGFEVLCLSCWVSIWANGSEAVASAWNRRADDLISITPKGLAMLGEDAE